MKFQFLCSLRQRFFDFKVEPTLNCPYVWAPFQKEEGCICIPSNKLLPHRFVVIPHKEEREYLSPLIPNERPSLSSSTIQGPVSHSPVDLQLIVERGEEEQKHTLFRAYLIYGHLLYATYHSKGCGDIHTIVSEHFTSKSFKEALQQKMGLASYSPLHSLFTSPSLSPYYRKRLSSLSE